MHDVLPPLPASSIVTLKLARPIAPILGSLRVFMRLIKILPDLFGVSQMLTNRGPCLTLTTSLNLPETCPERTFSVAAISMCPAICEPI